MYVAICTFGIVFNAWLVSVMFRVEGRPTNVGFLLLCLLNIGLAVVVITKTLRNYRPDPVLVGTIALVFLSVLAFFSLASAGPY